jgi:hypothetical protein
VIDNPAQVEHLIAKLRAALPLSATVSPSMLARLQEQVPDLALPPRCQITWIHYAGDEGGIVCKLDFGTEDDRAVFVVSITYLTFDRRLPLAREIAAYQKHRVSACVAAARRRRRGRITEGRWPLNGINPAW